MTPISPTSPKDVYCIEVAAIMCNQSVSSSLQASEDWDVSKQIGLVPSVIAQHIDGSKSHEEVRSNECYVFYEFCVMQYNVQTFIDGKERSIMYARWKKCHVSIACLNETREKINGIRNRGGYI